MSYSDDVKNYEEFNKKFPIEHLPQMTLEEYVNDKDRDGFLWWMLKTLGNLGKSNYGINPITFGIYKFDKEAKFGKNKNGRKDKEYAWKGTYGDTAESAFNKIKEKIITIAKYARDFANSTSNLDLLKKLDKYILPHNYQWKIAFFYSDQKLINWYSNEELKKFVKHFDEKSKLEKTSDLQLELMKIRDSQFTSHKDFYQKLWEIHSNANNINNEDKIMTDQNTNTSNLVKLLKNTKNIILHGAPGTGKTYLAREIAKAMNAEVGFVQFHPSYDYTDFVEGLRPVNKNKEAEEADEDSTQIGFERKDGVFKKFCEKALKASIKNRVDNFEDIWQNLVSKLNDEDFIDVPLLSNDGKNEKNIRIELNEYGNGLANRTYKDNNYEKGSWIRGQSKFFSKKQLYNIYKNLPGIPSEGHDNYRRAIVKYMKDKMGLKGYKDGSVESESKNIFVFIIDEINRGELSKIFGELFFAIDPDYRGDEKCKDLRTQYANMQDEQNLFDETLGITDSDNFGHFFVPDNVYIIGTMNDIDRSVESMDFAMRRRFTFKEIKASDSQKSILSKLDTTIDKKVVESCMNALNNAIWDEEKKTGTEGLSSAYHIGAAYFLKLNDFKDKTLDEKFDNLWEYHLEPLLKEYLRGMEDAESLLDKLYNAYFNAIKTQENNNKQES